MLTLGLTALTIALGLLLYAGLKKLIIFIIKKCKERPKNNDYRT